MERKVETEGADYSISTSTEEDKIKVSLKINVRDWKKASGLNIILQEKDVPFNLSASVYFGNEELYPSPEGSEYDHGSVDLFISAKSSNGENLYEQTYDVSGNFSPQIDFYLNLKPIKI